MKKATILGLTAALAAATAAAVLLGKREETGEQGAAGVPASQAPAPVDPDKTVAFPLKDKYADYSRGPDDPIYIFALDTPSGAKEVHVDKTQYETYYIGDEVICLETGGGLQIV